MADTYNFYFTLRIDGMQRVGAIVGAAVTDMEARATKNRDGSTAWEIENIGDTGPEWIEAPAAWTDAMYEQMTAQRDEESGQAYADKVARTREASADFLGALAAAE